jgi:RNA polymerase sigma-B factor
MEERERAGHRSRYKGVDVDTRAPRADADYAEVEQLLVAIADVPRTSAEFALKRAQAITKCLPLADHIAYRFVGRGESYEDLIQVARLGLINAVDRYNPEKGRFLAFAVPTILGEVRRYFRDNAWGMRVPRKLKETHLRLRAAIDPMSQRLGRAPTASELAAELGLDTDEVVQSLDVAYAFRPMSLDAAVPGSLGGDDLRYTAVEDRVAVADLVAHLSERDREILRMRFCDCMTQTQIAQRLGKSQVHVSRLLASTLERLRRRYWADDFHAPMAG